MKYLKIMIDKIILASKSGVRKKILEDHGIICRVEPSNVDEDSIKKSLLKKFNINKLNTNQRIQIILDKTNNKIKEFIFQISNTEKIYLSKNSEESKFKEKILTIKLDKKIIYRENIILQSLYKAATDQSIPPNTIIEFARIYGFQVDFQRDIRKEDKFQIMYEVFIDENDKKTYPIDYDKILLVDETNTPYTSINPY